MHFILRRGLFFGPSLRDTVGRRLHHHFKSIFISPLSGVKKIRRQSGLDDFLSVLFINCAGDAQYWWGEMISLYVLAVCGFCLFFMVICNRLVGSIDFFFHCDSYRVLSFFSSETFTCLTNIPLHLSSLYSQRVEILHIIVVCSPCLLLVIYLIT